MPLEEQHVYTKLGLKRAASERRAKQPSWRMQIILAVVAATVLSSSFTIAILRAIGPQGFLADIDHTHISESTSIILNSHSTPTRQRDNCGKSVEEALSLGCKFDPLSVAWMPPDCPREGTDEFVSKAGNGTKWRYWLDQEGKQELRTPSDLARIGSNGTYWTTQREHTTHCVYMLLRVHRAMERGDGRIDTLGRNYEHSKHCLMVLLTLSHGPNDDKITTSGDVGFATC